MKKIGLLFLAVVLALGVAGCKKDKDADPVGTWVVNIDVACNGSPDGTFLLHIFDNGTFNDGSDAGTWDVNKKDITMTYTGITIVLSGVIDGDQMSGTWVGFSTGCWTAQRTSTTP